MTANDHRHTIAVADPAALAEAAAERVLARNEANSGREAICLTGGSSPKPSQSPTAGSSPSQGASPSQSESDAAAAAAARAQENGLCA